MGSFGTRRLHKFTIPRKWSWLLDEADEAPEYRRIGNVSRFNPPCEETPNWEELYGDWADDLGEAGER